MAEVGEVAAAARDAAEEPAAERVRLPPPRLPPRRLASPRRFHRRFAYTYGCFCGLLRTSHRVVVVIEGIDSALSPLARLLPARSSVQSHFLVVCSLFANRKLPSSRDKYTHLVLSHSPQSSPFPFVLLLLPLDLPRTSPHGHWLPCALASALCPPLHPCPHRAPSRPTSRLRTTCTRANETSSGRQY